MSFVHVHPYDIFIPPACEKLIVGTLPPPRFSTRDLRPEDVDFCYGSCDNMLWRVLDELFALELLFDNSNEAVLQRKIFLKKKRIGICDIVQSCVRKKIDASDLGMEQVVLRDIFQQLKLHFTVNTLLFTGGNSKNGPEYFFRKQAREYGARLVMEEPGHPGKHSFSYAGRRIKTISLVSPSNAANRAIGSTALYKKRKQENPEYTTFAFRLEQYRNYF